MAASLQAGVALPASVTDQPAIEAAFARFGTPDVLVNNAGILALGTLLEQTPDQFRAVSSTCTSWAPTPAHGWQPTP